MKTFQFIAVLLLTLTAGAAWAQIESEAVTISKVKKGDVPAKVVAAFERDFPNAEPIDHVLMNLNASRERWAITKEDMDDYRYSNDKPQFYEIEMRGHKIYQQALYDASGKLLKLKTIMKDGTLPAAIKQRLTADYAGWKVIGDKEIINDVGRKPSRYRVRVEQGKEKKTLIFNEEGKVLNHVGKKRT